MFVIVFLMGGIPYTFLSSATVLSDITKAILWIVLGGAALTINTYLQSDPGQIGEEGIAYVTDLLRTGFRGFGAYIRIVIGAIGLVAALAEIINALDFHATMGFWSTETFCDAIHAGLRCPIRTPVLSWIFNAPAFLIYAAVGLALIYPGREILRAGDADT